MDEEISFHENGADVPRVFLAVCAAGALVVSISLAVLFWLINR